MKAPAATEGRRPSLTVRPRLRVGDVGDPAEREADAVAERVLRVPAGGGNSRPCCAGCAGDDEIRRRPAEGPDTRGPAPACPGGLVVAPAVESGIRARRGRGAPLPEGIRRFFEPRLAADLSGVRVHADAGAGHLAAGVQARAFTVGPDVFFGAGQWSPATDGGRRLLAHELAHTLQRPGPAGAAPALRRRVHPTRSSCPANVHGAPADPIAEIGQADAEAQRMALGASHLLFVESLTRTDPTFGPSEVSRAFLARFGAPRQLGNGRFQNRFTGASDADRDVVVAQEMQFLSTRFEQIHRFLTGDIDYDCPGTAAFTAGSCTGRCAANDVAHSCTASHGRQIKLCPGFWPGLSTAQRAGGLIHETVHMRFSVRPHDSATAAQRGRNPECHTSFVADLYNFTPFDPRCPAIP